MDELEYMELINDPLIDSATVEVMEAEVCRHLTQDDVVELQAIHTALNRLSGRLSAINEAVQGSVATSSGPSPHSVYDDIVAQIGGVATELPSDFVQDLERVLRQDGGGHDDSSGEYGLRYGDPIYYIATGLQDVRSRIGRLIHRQSLQTKTIPEVHLSSGRLSGGDSIRGQIDMPIVPNSRP